MSIQAECGQLQCIPLFRSVDSAKLKLIAMSGEHLTYRSGDPVFLQGEDADAVHVMLSGSVRIVTDDGVHAIELAHIDQPAVIGETGVISGKRRNASVYASSETQMLRINGQVFIELLEQVPGVAVALVRELVGRLQQSNDRLLQYHAEAPT